MRLRKLLLVVATTSIFSPSVFAMEPETINVVQIGPRARIELHAPTLKASLKNLPTEKEDPLKGRFTIGARSIETAQQVMEKISQKSMNLSHNELTCFLVCVAAQMKLDEAGNALPASILSLGENSNVTYCSTRKTFKAMYGPLLAREQLLAAFELWINHLGAKGSAIKESFRTVLDTLDNLKENPQNSKTKNELIVYLKMQKGEAQKGFQGDKDHPSEKILRWFKKALSMVTSNQNINEEDVRIIQTEFILI